MCAPDRPERDHYDDIPQVHDHFSPTPPLTALPSKHSYTRIAREVRNLLASIYRKHHLQRCLRYGLYYAGPRILVEERSADRVMLLVLELKKADINRWKAVHADVLAVMRDYGLEDPHGVCVRYYEFNPDAKVENLSERREAEGPVVAARPVYPTRGPEELFYGVWSQLSASEQRAFGGPVAAS